MFATDANLAGYGYLVSDPSTVEVEIVTWPTAGWRPVDEGTGNEAGTTEGDFDFWWNAGMLHGRNSAVNDEYVLARMLPSEDEAVIGHANYHPDGGQLFFPLTGEAFVIPLAKPGDGPVPQWRHGGGQQGQPGRAPNGCRLPAFHAQPCARITDAGPSRACCELASTRVGVPSPG